MTRRGGVDDVGDGPLGRTATSAGVLAAAGLAPERAIRRLRDAGIWGPDGPREGAVELVEELSRTADPEDALAVVCDLAAGHPELFAEVCEQDRWRGRLLAVAGASRPLGDLLARHENALRALREPHDVDPAAIAAEVAASIAAGEVDEPAPAVAAIRRRTTALVAARDLTGELAVDEVARDLARLAEGVLRGVVAALLAAAVEAGRPPIRLCVVGMGKLGGEELNYVSDVDVVFVHAPADGGDESVARDEAQRICAALLQILNASTTMGRAYEIDPTLRPEGRDGLLSRSLDSFTAYWERWAETWEFQAMLKARPVAGDLELGEELLRRAEPFVFPDRLDPAVVAEIRAMKGRVLGKAEVLREGERQLKLGPGGIRDIEFAVQLLQLVHGRADRSLRERGTLPALAALAAGGYVAEEDAEEFGETYRTLRDVEHRLQLAMERRTHTLPEDPGRLERLARSLGYEPAGDVPAREPFLRHLRAVQGRVRDLHAKLFYRPLLEVHAAVPASDAELVGGGLDGRLERRAALTRLEALGFHDGRAVLRDVSALTGGVTRRAAVLRGVLPAFLHGLTDTPDPDGGLQALRDLVESQQDDTALIAALRDQPPTVPLLARMLGTSRVVGELLASVPRGIDWVTDPDAREAPRTRDELARAALALLGWQDGLAEREGALRRFKRRELVRVVVRDLAGTADVTTVAAELAALGDACLEAGLTAVLDEIDPDRGGPARVAIIGLGKLGGRELHYISDLDVVFVHEAAGGAAEDVAARFAVEVAERVLRSLSSVTAEGTAFEVDPELRPEGRSGPLSRSIESCRAYYERWGETWERLALLKARHVAGDREVGRRFVELANEHAYPRSPEDAGATELRRMKARIERERVPQRVDANRHLKLGPGGLADTEWTTQLLQRLHGHRETLARTTSTLTAIDGLHDAGILEGRDAGWLRDGYRLLSRTRNALYLLRRRDVDVLPSSDEALERLARSLGYGRGGRQQFEADYLRATRRVRQVTERLFYGT